ncbi:MAG: thiamine pyrophosphate-binding protein [Acidobacteriota bacterium]|nr:thiamine pyrophosphate-binding protein [Acidobacteriota bacterium]
MKEIIKDYLDRTISRRRLLSGLGTMGVASIAAKSMASSLAAFQAPPEGAENPTAPAWMKRARGTGGKLLVEQLKQAGVNHMFVGCSASGAPIFDALADEPDFHIIQALQEGAVAAMADGYAKASGKTPFCYCSPRGIPNFMTQMFNSHQDNIPMVVTADYPAVPELGEENADYADHVDEITQPMTKWHWVVETTEKIPELTRRAIAFASTRPCGPVFLAFPSNVLSGTGEADIMDQSKFNVSGNTRPDPADIDRAARLLLEARSPLLYVGDEITWDGAQREVLELAELLALPVAQPAGSLGWSIPFPTRNPLFLGDYQKQFRFLGDTDVMLNLGAKMPVRHGVAPTVKVIQVRQDPVSLARLYPTEVAIVANLKMATADLLAAIRSLATPARLQHIRDSRYSKIKDFTNQLDQFQHAIAAKAAARPEVSLERTALDLEAVLDKESYFVGELNSARPIEKSTLMRFGGDDKQYLSNTGRALGWSLSASVGIKLAQPDRPVVAMMGDGAFLFGGPQGLWSMARYKAPVTSIIWNNRSYDVERTGMFTKGGRQFETGRDMVCYLGDPDIDYTKIAAGFDVEGEAVKDAASLRPTLERAKRANIEGRPYLIDLHAPRHGPGASSTWHPDYSIAALRKREV